MALNASHVRPAASPILPWIICAVVAGGVVLLAAQMSVALAAVIYAAVFFTIALARPDVALTIMFISAMFPYDLSGGGPAKTALGEIDLMLILPAMLIRSSRQRRPLRFSPVHLPSLIYLAVCLVSFMVGAGLAEDTTAEMVVSMLQMVLYLIIAVVVLTNYVQRVEEFLPALYGSLVSAAFLAGAVILGVDQRLRIHKNAIGCFLSYAVIICTALWIAQPRSRRRIWLLAVLVFLAVGLLMCLSRGGWAGAICGMAFLFVLYGQWRRLLSLAIVIIPIIAVAWWLLPPASKAYATDFSGGARLASWQEAMTWFKSSPVLGIGVGLRKKYDATNVIASTLAETGVVGLLAFAAIHVVYYQMIWKARRRLPTSSGAVMLLGLGGALVLCQFVHGCVDHYWSRALLIVWSSAGMATFAYRLAIPSARPPHRPAASASPFGSQPAKSAP